MYSITSAKEQSWLSWFLRGVLIVGFLILFVKLLEVQLIKGDYYRKLAEENRVRHIPIPAPRGKIIARGGEVLVGNVEVKKRVKFKPHGGFEITDDLTDAAPEEIIIDYKRVYPLGEKFAHASGYLGIVGEGGVGKIDPSCPEKGPTISGALVGKTGLEAEFQCQLSGVNGEELIEVNTAGKKIRSLGRREPIPGADIKSTIDYNLQELVATEMDNKKGAAIVTDTNGQILAFYSSPSYDPNLFVNNNKEETGKILTNLFKNTDLPFFNRVIGGTFHPGSVFKPVVAVAALEERAIDRSFTYTDTGTITVNGFSYTNWYFTEFGKVEGVLGLTKAIARSTDTFFYKIGEMTGPDNLAKWANTFGLNKPTGINIPGEVSGLIPTPEWKKKVKKEAWFLGNTYNMSIGQGDVAVTPIEINTYIAAIAAGGKICKPTFVQSSGDCKQISVSKDTLTYIKEGMNAACTSGGTAYTFFDFPAKHGGQEVDCKTGTAEVSAEGTPHAWFTFFTPADNPQIVSTILFEKGGQGSTVAGPVARKIADFYFQTGETTR